MTTRNPYATDNADIGLQHRYVLRGLTNLDRLTDDAARPRYDATVGTMRASARRILRSLDHATAEQCTDAARFLAATDAMADTPAPRRR